MTTTVSYLKKVSLEIHAMADKSNHELSAKDQFSFIFGVASGGLCPFEADLAEMAVGDSVALTVKQRQLSEYFAHLYRPLAQFLNLQILPVELTLTIRVAQIDKPGDQEVVAAMTAAIAGGCGAGCDCGCH